MADFNTTYSDWLKNLEQLQTAYKSNPDYITAANNAWGTGEEVNVPGLTEQFRLDSNPAQFMAQRGIAALGGADAFQHFPGYFAETKGMSPTAAATYIYGPGHVETRDGDQWWVTDAGTPITAATQLSGGLKTFDGQPITGLSSPYASGPLGLAGGMVTDSALSTPAARIAMGLAGGFGSGLIGDASAGANLLGGAGEDLLGEFAPYVDPIEASTATGTAGSTAGAAAPAWPTDLPSFPGSPTLPGGPGGEGGTGIPGDPTVLPPGTPGGDAPVYTQSPAYQSALQRLISGQPMRPEDWVSLAGTAAVTAAGVVGANDRANSLSDLQDRYFNLGGPSRARLEASYAPGFSMTSEPGYQDAIDQTMNAYLRKASTGGNPFENPGVSMEALKYVTGGTALPQLNTYRSQLAGQGGLGINTAGTLGLAGANAGSDAYAALGYGIGQLTNPQPSLADLLRQYGIGSNYQLGRV